MENMKIHGVDLIEQDDMVCLSYRNHGDFEPESVAKWVQVCSRPGAVAIDVGAYTGLYSLLAAKAGATVYAFEPGLKQFGRFMENWAESGLYGVIFENAAIGAVAGFADYQFPRRAPALTSAGRAVRSEGGSLRLVTLDSLLLTRCDIIKIDVEGAEVEVLQGAANLIEGQHPVIIAEANTREHRWVIDEVLGRHGYPPGKVIDGRNVLYVHPAR